ncbi:MAG TPA: HesA/MoeB/ThiF family protein [Candidatus Kryptonia bacterium]|nr:HesA/MoeB/ThiF family protein [Candidatus Kryptonia bacterium]
MTDLYDTSDPAARRERLRRGRVLVVGVGGLGCPAALQLAAAGVGTIGLIDPDRVELSNLNRQILHDPTDLGREKVDSARAKLHRRNPAATIHVFAERLTASNLPRLFSDFDFVIDGTDNVAAKFLINDGAVLNATPFSHAGVLGFHGQTMTVLPRRTTCYRCLFPAPPDADAPTCQEAGVLGVITGAIGIMQAAEAVKFLLGSDELLTDRLLTVDALELRWRSIPLRRNPRCPLCGERPTLTTLAEPAQAA